MGVQKIPLFYSGNLLTQDMMEAMKNYALDYTIQKYSGYADGILRGCGITISDQVLTIHPGILIAGQKPFFIGEAVGLRCEPANTVKYLIARIGEIEHSRCFETQNIEFLSVDEDGREGNDIELCRFRLQQGTKLRYEYRDYEDMNTEFDTVCLGHAQWAAFGGASLSYEILLQFAAEALKTPLENPEDRMFTSQILAANGETLTASCINCYIAGRLGKPYTEQGIKEMYQGLGEVLKMLKSGKGKKGKAAARERRILVD